MAAYKEFGPIIITIQGVGEKALMVGKNQFMWVDSRSGVNLTDFKAGKTYEVGGTEMVERGFKYIKTSKEVGAPSASVAAPTPVPAAANAVPVAVENDSRQRSIVRQSSLKAATELLASIPENEAKSIENVLHHAAKFEEWVNR